MICTKNDKTHFEQAEEYTVLCEVCDLYVKLYKFRSCEARHQKLMEQGIDVFKDSKELEKMLAFQMGQTSSNPTQSSKTNNNSTKKAPSSRRGR